MITIKETIIFLLIVNQNLLKAKARPDQIIIKKRMIKIGMIAVNVILKSIIDSPNSLKLWF